MRQQSRATVVERALLGCSSGNTWIVVAAGAGMMRAHDSSTWRSYRAVSIVGYVSVEKNGLRKLLPNQCLDCTKKTFLDQVARIIQLQKIPNSLTGVKLLPSGDWTWPQKVANNNY